MQNIKYKKFQRRYVAKFTVQKIENMQVQKGIVESFSIEYPYTLELNTKVGLYNTSAQGAFKFYNIDKTKQKALWKDIWDNSRRIHLELRAGYQDNLKLIFSGYVMKGYTYRNGGDTNFITEIECSASPDMFSQNYSNKTLSAKTPPKNLIQQLLDGIDNFGIGYISKELESLKRDTPFLGNPIELLKNHYSKYNVFIENGLINILADNEHKSDELLVITAESGLLGSPRRSEARTIVDMLFEPNASVGGLVNVLSDSMPELNQTFQTIEVEHKGIISAVESGKLTTTLTLSMGKNLISVKRSKADEKYKGSVTAIVDWLPPAVGPVKSPFGKRIAPTAGASENHMGVDIGAKLGDNVFAPAKGKVIECAQDSLNGKYIRIHHGKINGNDIVTSYAHLSEILVTVGQEVFTGKVIGKVGSTGISTGAHLHFSVRENGKFVNPSKYIKGY